MKQAFALLFALAVFQLLLDFSAASGQRHGKTEAGAVLRAPAARAWINPGPPIYRYGHAHRYHPHTFRHYPPAAVTSPYGPTYYYAPRVIEATTPYFCALHNVGFLTRAGMLDHLAGTHKYPLQSASHFCPSGAEICIYPLP
jgi:hypothetical protein